MDDGCAEACAPMPVLLEFRGEVQVTHTNMVSGNFDVMVEDANALFTPIAANNHEVGFRYQEGDVDTLVTSDKSLQGIMMMTKSAEKAHLELRVEIINTESPTPSPTKSPTPRPTDSPTPNPTPNPTVGGYTFVGWATFSQKCNTHDEETSNQHKDEACRANYGSSSFSVRQEEFFAGMVAGAPSTNTSGTWLIFKDSTGDLRYPDSTPCSAKEDQRYEVCIQNGASLNCDPLVANSCTTGGCSGSSRTTMCVTPGQ